MDFYVADGSALSLSVFKSKGFTENDDNDDDIYIYSAYLLLILLSYLMM